MENNKIVNNQPNQNSEPKKEFNKPKKNFNNSPSKDGLYEKTVLTKRINKTTKGGRRGRFSAAVVVGDKKGLVGFGIGKAVEITEAIRKAAKNARKNVVKVLINKKSGLCHDVFAKFGASEVLIKTAPVGSGIVAGGVIRTILTLAGFKDCCSKNMGSSCLNNMAVATIKALLQQRTYKEINNARFSTMGPDKKPLPPNNFNKLFKGGYNK